MVRTDEGRKSGKRSVVFTTNASSRCDREKCTERCAAGKGVSARVDVRTVRDVD